MKQTFEIESSSGKLNPSDVEKFLNRQYFSAITVTEITEPGKCAWESWKDHDGDIIWSTKCKNEHKFFCDGPEENKYTHCPYCGKPIEVRDGK